MSAASRGIDRLEPIFDHDGLVANAGLILPATLMCRLGLEALIDQWVRTGSSRPGRKVLSLVAAMIAGPVIPTSCTAFSRCFTTSSSTNIDDPLPHVVAHQAAFHTPVEAVRAALDAQRSFGEESWVDGFVLHVGMGLHIGTAEERYGDYFGQW